MTPESEAPRQPNVLLMSAAGIAGILVITLINVLYGRISTGLWVALLSSIVMVLIVLFWSWAWDRGRRHHRHGVQPGPGEPAVMPRWVPMLFSAITPIVIAPLVGLALGALWIGLLVAALCTASAVVMFTILIVRDYTRHGDVDPSRW